MHDPAKLSICQSFLRGSCANPASACPLSHVPTTHNTPSCSHFALAGACRAGQACLYPHVRLPDDARLCAAFTRYGWCDKGPACADRHSWECKEFAEDGKCRMDGKCGLKHVLSAAAGRAPASPTGAGDVADAFFFDSTGDRPAGDDNDDDGSRSRRHGPRVDSGALIANQDDFIQLDFDTDSEDYESGSEEEEEGEEGGATGESAEEAGPGDAADDDDDLDEAEVADAVALLVDDDGPASDADEDDPRPRR